MNRKLVFFDSKEERERYVIELYKISMLQIRVIEIINPILRVLLINTEKLAQITGATIDSDEILTYYKHFGLDTKVEPVLKHLAKISNDPEKQGLRSPFNKWGIISPLEVDSETLQEYFNPEEYYEEKLGEEFNIIKQEYSSTESERDSIERTYFDGDDEESENEL